MDAEIQEPSENGWRLREPQSVPANKPEWRITVGLTDYAEAMQVMEERVAAIIDGTAPELVWLLEHPPLYTAGTGANPTDLINPQFPIHTVGRGGKYTYHGPGQRVIYTMLDLRQRGQDVRHFVWNLEEWIIRALARVRITAERRDDTDDRRVGLWVKGDGCDNKIAAIGIRVRKWVAFHGIAINVNPNLSHYAGIVPCGIKGHGLTTVQQLQPAVTMADIDSALRVTFTGVFE
jgi:lipoyl(octanoyl) transferase